MTRPAFRVTIALALGSNPPRPGPLFAYSKDTMIRIALTTTWLLIAMCLSLPALGQQEPPPPPEEVFRYVISDAGDALEIDWAVNDDAYMYRDSFGFSSMAPSIELGEAELPEGKVYNDEFLGEQVIYRDNFFIRIPYTVKGDKPDSFALTIESRGCLDAGFCYMPQTWIESVALEPAVSTAKGLDFKALAGGGEDEFPPPDEVFFPDVLPIDGNNVELIIRIKPGFYIYKNKIAVNALSDEARTGNIELPQGKLKTDEFFGEQEVYYDEVLGRVAIARATPDAMDLEIEVEYQGCADGGLCYLPQIRTFNVSLPAATAVTELSPVDARAAGDAPESEQARLARIITDSPLWAAAGVFFILGLGLAFTPCVLPMVPILSGIIAGEGDDVSALRGFSLAFTYVMGMALVYTAAGVASAAAGMQLQAVFNQPWILVLFSGLFVVLALAMFGVYDLQMPSGIQSRLANVSGNQKSGTVIGAFVMGALSALVVTACVAPALIAALTVMAQSKDMVRGGTALFAMSLGMGAPLLAVGAAQGKLLPKAGAWMVAIKGAFGFMMLGLAIWMLSRILPGGVTMSMWAALIFMAGVFMGGLTTLTGDSAVTQKFGKGFGLLAILYGLALFLGALTGGTNPLKPLASVNFGGGAAGFVTADEKHLQFKRIKTVADFERELATAVAAGKSVMLDFYADWCVSCIEMEEYTFITPEVQAALADTVTLQADVTKADEQDRELLQRFGSFGPPTIVFFTAQGEHRPAFDIVGFMKAEDFAAHVRRAIAVSSELTT